MSPSPRSELPEIGREEFLAAIRDLSPEELSATGAEALFVHFQELRRWNRTLSLIGPGTVAEVLARHYGEALAALPLIAEPAKRLVDVGSGGGFPGFVLAAARPGLEVTLVEPRQRKAAFLRAASRRAALPCHILDARVASPLPAEIPGTIDVVTMRALRLSGRELSALADRLSAGGRFLLWVGGDEPELPGRLAVERRVSLEGSERRSILVIGRRDE